MTFVVRLVIKFRIWNWDDLTLGFSHVGGSICLQAGFNLLIVYTLGPGNGAMDYDFHSLVKRARQELIHSFYKTGRNGKSIYIYSFLYLSLPFELTRTPIYLDGFRKSYTPCIWALSIQVLRPPHYAAIIYP